MLFESEQEWDAFRALPAVRSALDAVPAPVNGLLVYKGRGGGSGPRKPRKPRPAPSASSMELPEPVTERVLKLTEAMADEQDGVMIGASDFAQRTPQVARA